MEALTGLWFISSLVLGISCAIIGGGKGRNTFGWFVVGFLTNVLGMLFALIASPNEDKLDEEAIKAGTRKRCNYCAEVIRVSVTRCPHCTSTLEVEEHTGRPSN